MRMEIAEVHPGGRVEPLEQLVHPVAVGADTFSLGYVTPDTLRAVCQVLRNFNQLLAEYRVKEIRAVATSPIREASNQDILLDRIRHETGLVFEVLDATAESRLTYQTLMPFLQANGIVSRNRHALLLDLGGGSTEFMVLRGKDLVFVGSRRLGTMRLFQSISGADFGDSQAVFDSVIRNVVHSTLELCRAYPIREVVVINSLLPRALAKEPGAEAVENGLVLSTDAARAAARETESMTLEALRRRFGVSQADAETLLPALLVLDRFLESIPVERVVLSGTDLLTGVLNDMALQLNGRDPLQDFHRQILGSATGVAEKYHYDPEHAQQVAWLACELYDGLADYLDLSGKDRLYLEVSAILHDIGMYVSEGAHHKHSAYLIRWSEIVGLNPHERFLVSQIARYHRKNTPQPSHTEYAALPAEERLRINKISAILRIADALDRGHRQLIREIDAEITGRDLVLHARSEDDLTVEQLALREKGEHFEQITGLRVRLEWRAA
jgi:exopolyphosphatase/guanosine-5'-triphosphate,3'-diphosphate pyrophosphatase